MFGARRQARRALPAHAEQAVPHRRAADEPDDRPDRAEPDPCVLPQPGADQRRQEQHVRRHVAGRRLDHGLLRRLAVQAVAMGARVHPRRPLLHGRVRRLLPQPPVPDLRLRAAASECAGIDARAARCRRQADEAPGLAVGQRRRGEGLQQRRRPGDARRLSVNTTQPPYQPSGVPPADGGPLDLADPKGATGYGEPLPPQTAKTIGDTLSAKGVDWAWYAGGWNLASADGRQPRDGQAQGHLHPRARRARCSSRITSRSTTTRASPRAPPTAPTHLKDGDELLQDIAVGTPARRELLQAGRALHAASVVHRREERRRAHGRPAGAAAREPAVGGHADRPDLRRERRLLGPRARRRPAPAGATASAPARASRR